MLIGFHAEGHDHLVLRALLARLLDIPEDSIETDQVDLPSRGWQQILATTPQALHRFYGKGARAAVISVDNDGGVDLAATGGAEDPRHPRHWNHLGADDLCRQCGLDKLKVSVASSLNWNTALKNPWPIVVAVPVEAIESWLLILAAAVTPGRGSLHAEREARGPQKMRLYARPAATLVDVERVALPLIRSSTPAQFAALRTHSKSFELFANQVVSSAPW